MLLLRSECPPLVTIVFSLLPPAVCCSGWWGPASLPRSSWTWPLWTRCEWLGHRQLSGWPEVVQRPIRNHIQPVQQWAREHIWGKRLSLGEHNFSLTLVCAELMRCQAWTCVCSYVVASRECIITARGFPRYGKTTFGKWCWGLRVEWVRRCWNTRGCESLRDKAEKGVKLLTPFCSHGKGPHSKYCVIGMSAEVGVSFSRRG